MEDLRQHLLNTYQSFLEGHKLRLVIEYIRDVNATTENSSSSTTLPSLGFSKRQKLHVKNQMLRCRHFYLTPFNKNVGINRYSPFVMRKPPADFDADLTALQNNFSEKDFSGMWLSVHTAPYLVNDSDGIRNTIVCWALIELWTNNERSLKALWIHPTLSSNSTTLLLMGFVPLMIAEALCLPAEESATSPQCFFFVWQYLLGMSPRCCLPLLLADEYIGLPLHFDAIGEEGHTDDGEPPGSICNCVHRANQEDSQQMLFGASTEFLKSRIETLKAMVPTAPSEQLVQDVEYLLHSDYDCLKTASRECNSDVIQAECAGLSLEKIQELLIKCYGKNGYKWMRLPPPKSTTKH